MSLVAITAYSDIWTSSNSGAMWSNQTRGTAASGQDWQGVASDSTGTHLVAVCDVSLTSGGVLYGGDIWMSTDSGTTWTNRTKGTAASGSEWVAAASDATGSHIVAASACHAAHCQALIDAHVDREEAPSPANISELG